MRQNAIDHFLKQLQDFSLTSMKVIDIGGQTASPLYLNNRKYKHTRLNPLPSHFAEYQTLNWKWGRIEDPCDISHDITKNIPQQHQNIFDLVISFDSLEHVINPFQACYNMAQLAKIDGLIYVATVFAWPRHGQVDYFRFSPLGLDACFMDTGIQKIASGWDPDRYWSSQTGVFFFGKRVK